jgi:DNA-directed RNA polymerase specialized sigma24 family protein
MESRNRYDGVDAYAVTKIRHHARQLSRSRAFHSSDIEDLEQELMLDLLRRLPVNSLPTVTPFSRPIATPLGIIIAREFTVQRLRCDWPGVTLSC